MIKISNKCRWKIDPNWEILQKAFDIDQKIEPLVKIQREVARMPPSRKKNRTHT